MVMPLERIRRFTDRIWGWYLVHKRVLPWRDLWDESEISRAYKVLISEVMLQQTQVPRVAVLFPEFLNTFPTLEALAEASNKDVVMAWRGMGYNRRALMLRDAARHICDRNSKFENSLPLGGIGPKERGSNSSTKQGKFIHPLSLTLSPWERGYGFPKEMQELLTIPGIGPYTAAAIRNFAFNIPTPCLDTNIRRVLYRAFVRRGEPDDKYLLRLASVVLNVAIQHSPSTIHYAAADWHHALMDYGSLVQKAARVSRDVHKEPGRLVGKRFTPNRIFRGKIVNCLRDQSGGLTLEKIGERICSDWNVKLHGDWFMRILDKLQKDALVMEIKGKYVLKE